MGEVGICISPATLPPITHVGVVYCRVSHFLLVLLTKNLMFIREVEIGLIPATLPPITHIGVVGYHVSILLHVLLTKVCMMMIGVI